MAVKFEQKLGVFKGRTHLLFWEAKPDMDSLEEFVVNISYSDFSGWEPRRIQIVRIDNVEKPLHMDPADHDEEKESISIAYLVKPLRKNQQSFLLLSSRSRPFSVSPYQI